MRRPILALRLTVFLLLTILTQIGGLAYLLALMARRARLLVFLGAYVATSLAATQIVPLLGRVPLPCNTETLQTTHPLYCALNRHYVSPELRDYTIALAAHMEARFPGTITLTLDGNFPFLDGFPLLPHLSHDDGDKLDLAFYYEQGKEGYAAAETPSPIGFWVFEQPLPDEPQPCAGRDDWLTMRWDMGWLQSLGRDLSLEPKRTAEALRWLAANPPDRHSVKILLEPHLKARMVPELNVVRFQGCRAARHDDHIHLQIARLP